MDATAQNILDYARMASRFLERVHGVERPSVGLLNVGEEPEKGGRGKKETRAEIAQLSRRYVSEARTVLAHSHPLAEAVLWGLSKRAVNSRALVPDFN